VSCELQNLFSALRPRSVSSINLNPAL